MASVTTEKRNGKALYRIEYRDKDKRRRKLRLGSLSKRDAQSIALKVQSIISAQVAGNDLPTATTEWLKTISDDLHTRLAEQGLCKVRVTHKLSEWVDNYIYIQRKNSGEHWHKNYSRTQALLIQHFGEVAMGSITPEQAQGFRDWLSNELCMAQATIAGHIKRAKQFFAAAVKAGAIASSPFFEVVAGSQVNTERSVYVSAEDIERAIDMAPDAQWRLLIALSRYAGLRCPSETLALRWCDVDFTAGTMQITSSKTAKQGKSKRQVPIFPSLKPYFEDAFEPEHERCISRYIGVATNLRTTFLKIITKAGLEPWPRLFHNLRGSLQTDLMERFPAHVVCQWLGNTEKVALNHYLKVTPEHIARAIGDAGGKVGQQVGTSLQETPSKGGNERKQIPEIPEENEKARAIKHGLIHPRGFEPLTLGSEDRCSVQLSYGCVAYQLNANLETN